jgi:FkbM family methyltransferase
MRSHCPESSAMTEKFLHNLGDLPGSASVCLVGERGRNSRFLSLLRACRPDIQLSQLIETSSAGLQTDQCSLHGGLSWDSLKSRDLVLITSGKYKPVCASLIELGATRYLVVNPNFVHPFLHLGTEIDEHIPRMLEAKAVFEHDQDGRIYDLIVSALRDRTDLRGLYQDLIVLYGRMGKQYLDYIVPSAIRTVIEGGVADGRTTIDFLYTINNSFVYGFEPDDSVYKLSHFRWHLENHPRVLISPLALWSKSARLPLQSNTAGRSRISAEEEASGDRMVNAISIDEYVRGQEISKVDFIKLDIEGSEIEALEGAIDTIAKHRPQLAVCIYHRLDHYYKVPLFLSECTTDYVFRIGHYSARYLFSETVLYAIPKELATP